VHSGALGWVGMASFAILYWLTPRLYERPLYSVSLATTHFWLATIGIVLYTVAMWMAGVTEGLMARGIGEDGGLLYATFIDIVVPMKPFYWMRFIGGSMYLFGALLLGFNLIKTAFGPATAPVAAPAAN